MISCRSGSRSVSPSIRTVIVAGNKDRTLADDVVLNQQRMGANIAAVGWTVLTMRGKTS